LDGHGGHTGHGFVFRPGTNDEGMFTYIQENDDYHLPLKFEPSDIVIDIGMHIGAFCYKVLKLGACHVYAFEAERSNYECAVRNLKSFGDRIHLHHKAVWRSDRKGDKLFYCPSDDRENWGGGHVFWARSGQEVPVIALDDVLTEVTRRGRRRVRLLKIDCEGSEFQILLTSRLLHLIDEIAGEYHEYGCKDDQLPILDHARVAGCEKHSVEELTKGLQRAGFRVTSQAYPVGTLGLFHAVYNLNRAPMREIVKSRVRSTWQAISRRLKAS
jgi:FkbM family methyltransferase